MHRFLLFMLVAACLSRGDVSVFLESAQYRLYVRDLVRVAVQGEPDMSVERRIDGLGEINVPLIGAVRIGGLTISEAQDLIMKRYREEEIFISPEVVLGVVEYAQREVLLLGQVARQGKVSFPPEAGSLSIVEAITTAGGLTRIARGDSVRVTRRDAAGGEESFTVNVERMIGGRSSGTEFFHLQPGDVVFVPERLF